MMQPRVLVVTNKKKKLLAKKWALGMALGLIAGAIFAVLCSFLYRKLLYYSCTRLKHEGAVIYSSLIKKVEDLTSLEIKNGLILA